MLYLTWCFPRQLCFITILFTLSCAHFSRPPWTKVRRIELKDPPAIGRSLAGQDLHLGGFSGLHYLGKSKNGDYEFVTITNRGPHGDQYNGNRSFLLPDYSPRLVFFSVSRDFKDIKLGQMTFLKTETGPITGLPGENWPEDPVDIFDYLLRYDPSGMDTAAVVRAASGEFWVAEEYKPSIAEFTSEGILIKRFDAGKDFKDIFQGRRLNRGFTGLTIHEGKLWAFLESPPHLKTVEHTAPVLVMDLRTKRFLPEKYYTFESGLSDRIGDVTTTDQGLLILERDEKTGPESFKKIYLIKENPENQNLQKFLIADLSRLGLTEVAKLDGLAVVDNKYLFLMNNNDFGLRGRPDYLHSGLVPTKAEGSYLYVIELSALAAKGEEPPRH